MNKIQNQFRIFSNISKMQRIFVYGTLKKGQPNHKFIADAENGSCIFIGTGRTVDKWPLVIASKYNIPFLLDNKGHGKRVTGEVYSVNPQLKAILDKLEIKYQEIELDVELDNQQEETKCSCYVINNFKQELMELDLLESYIDVELRFVRLQDREPNDFYDYITDVRNLP
ncbi:unnamed protein product [Owenia fusiformis]|uniref:Gamma-glutamylcyclotransferase family protein n=1 Tax=Owenia fusiformis TaxID=6347 RepID=A0A8J1USM8_OWEFU|nr:unnamed protein product [Owenia fusiformis]